MPGALLVVTGVPDPTTHFPGEFVDPMGWEWGLVHMDLHLKCRRSLRGYCENTLKVDYWVGHWAAVYSLQGLYLPTLDQRMEKAMAPHSSTLAWKIPWTEQPGGLQSMGSLGVGHDWATSLSLFTFMHWSRKWQPTPVFLPGESQGQGSLVGCRPRGCTESDMTEAT